MGVYRANGSQVFRPFLSGESPDGIQGKRWNCRLDLIVFRLSLFFEYHITAKHLCQFSYFRLSHDLIELVPHAQPSGLSLLQNFSHSTRLNIAEYFPLDPTLYYVSDLPAIPRKGEKPARTRSSYHYKYGMSMYFFPISLNDLGNNLYKRTDSSSNVYLAICEDLSPTRTPLLLLRTIQSCSDPCCQPSQPIPWNNHKWIL
ncbi:hypothetical protein HZ326_29207 [Fusarium oxysporum f. sp. albedinis]|nr:hypothetical protein HZ326_29207 [Fusarium oxysporum f. sp. albedinis]